MLSREGFLIFKLPIRERQLAFVKLILSHRVFNLTMKSYFEKRGNLSKDLVVEIMKRSNIISVNSEQTFRRRASTVISWINWIVALIDENPLSVEQNR